MVFLILGLVGFACLLLFTVNDPRLIPFAVFSFLMAIFLTWILIPILALHLREKRRIAASPHDEQVSQVATAQALQSTRLAERRPLPWPWASHLCLGLGMTFLGLGVWRVVGHQGNAVGGLVAAAFFGGIGIAGLYRYHRNR